VQLFIGVLLGIYFVHLMAGVGLAAIMRGWCETGEVIDHTPAFRFRRERVIELQLLVVFLWLPLYLGLIPISHDRWVEYVKEP
jgi:hypothetical protein